MERGGRGGDREEDTLERGEGNKNIKGQMKG